MNSLRKYGISPIQEQFWLQYKMDPEGSAYNMASLFEISGPLDMRFVKRSLEILAERHELLKSRFVLGEEGPIILIEDKNLASVQEKTYDYDLLIRDIETPFKIDTGPLCRYVIYHRGKINYILFVFHHLIIDLRSKDIFGRDFSLCYNALTHNQSPDFVETDQYNLFVKQTKSFSLTEKYEEMLAFWRGQVTNIKPLTLSEKSVNRSHISNSRGTKMHGHFPPELHFALHRFCKREKTYPFLVILSVYYLFLYKYSGESRISVGVPRTNRQDSSFDEVFGCFVNTLPMVVDLSESANFCDLLQQVRRKMLLIHRNQFVPYLEVIKRSNAFSNKRPTPLFQVGFTSEYPMELYLEGLTAEPMIVPGHGAQLDLFLNFWQRNGVSNWEVEYSTNIFTEERIHLFISSFYLILKQVTETKSLAIDEISWQSVSCGKKSLSSCNKTTEEEKRNKDSSSRIEDIWKELLGFGDLSRDENFFDMGGNSLLLIKLQKRLEHEFNRPCPIGILFSLPTIKSQEEYFQE